MNKTSVLRILTAMFCLAIVSSQQLGSMTQASTLDNAKKEGRLTWYTSMGAGDAKLIVDAFESEYGFIEVSLFRGSDESILSRIINENRAGAKPFDVVSASQINTLAERQLIIPYASPESEKFPREAKDPANLWTAMYYNYYVLGYNTKMVEAADAPKKWGDLLQRKWKGKVAIDRDEIPWYATLLAVWGREKTHQYMKELVKQDIQWRKGHTLIANLMTAGEFPVAIVYSYTIDQLKRAGAPVEWIKTLDPIVAQGGFIALGARAVNVNSAKLFIDFVLSSKGQSIFAKKHRVPARSGVRTKAKLDVGYVPADVASHYQEYQREFRRIFRLN